MVCRNAMQPSTIGRFLFFSQSAIDHKRTLTFDVSFPERFVIILLQQSNIMKMLF